MPGPFAETQRRRLAELRLTALEGCWDVELLLGRHAETVDELADAVREHPLRERLVGMLMLGLYRCGRQADALAVFNDTQHRLADELGIDPAPEVRQLHQHIVRADPVLRSRWVRAWVV